MVPEELRQPLPPAGWRRLFYGEHGLRAGWCLLRFAIVFSLIAGGARWLYLRFDPSAARQGWTPRILIAADGIELAAALLCVALASRLERRPWTAYYLGSPRAAFGARFWEGVAWGVVPVSALIGAIALCGGYTVTGLAATGGALANSAVLWALAFLLVALYEEVVFRGYMLATLARGMGFWPAALLQSAIFGGAHYFLKPMETWADGLSTGLIGFFLCVLVWRTGDIWMAVGFHFGWNFLALAVFGGPNTGNDGHPVAGHLLASSFHGPRWLTGGPMGPEASLLVFPLLAALFAACAWRFHSGEPDGSRRAG
jgi:uncharacterized protein